MQPKIIIRGKTELAKCWGRFDNYHITYTGADGVARDYDREIYDHGLAAAVLMYDPDTRQVFGSKLLPYTTVFAMVGVARFLQLVKGQKDAESPTEAMLRDPLFIANFAAWAGAVLFMLYG